MPDFEGNIVYKGKARRPDLEKSIDNALRRYQLSIGNVKHYTSLLGPSIALSFKVFDKNQFDQIKSELTRQFPELIVTLKEGNSFPAPEKKEKPPAQDIVFLYRELSRALRSHEGKTPEEKQQSNKLLQQINRAYTQGDIQTLQQIKREYGPTLLAYVVKFKSILGKLK